ncbi:glycosyltransferase [Clostridium celatum]|uniref:glycosyltransferase n=1 Tax=Clostridium celatum TaxID=36834 RepID=UPI00319E26BA
MRKKHILFVIDSLHCAGAEKSLTTLLSLIDYSKYSVDLQLFGYGGALEELLPKEVNLLKSLKYTSFCDLSIKSAIGYSIKNFDYKMLLARLKFTLAIRKEKYSNAQKARVFWEKVSNVVEKNEKEYDIAISYAQGVPTFYVADKIAARKKYAWVNTSYKLDGKEKEFVEKYYDEYENIVAVSDSAKDIYLKIFPQYQDKVTVIYDIVNESFINRMSLLDKDKVNNEIDSYNTVKILTLGRLAYGKRYDRALEACKILKNKGINFKWYALGIGPLKEEIENYIKENNLEENFILLGVKSNPYPYIRKCDIYVQTSDFEGFGLAIAEARILNKPVVTTRFDAVYNQMIDRKNGLVVDMNAEGVANGILELINNKELNDNIVNYLKSEKKGNIEELDKFYDLIGR